MKNLISLVFLVCLWCGNAVAENNNGLYLVPGIGYMNLSHNWLVKDNYIYSLGVGYDLTKKWSVEGNYTFMDSDTNKSGGNADMDMLRLDALYHLDALSGISPYFVGGLGRIDINRSGRRSHINDQLFNLGFGLEYYINKSISLRTDVRGFRTFKEHNGDSAISFGLAYHFAKAAPAPADPDHDQDGVRNLRDDCLGTLKGVTVDASGCPLDGDNDGVWDIRDECLQTPAGDKVDFKGCSIIIRDSDGDGVLDNADECPNTPPNSRVNRVGCREQVTKTIRINLLVEFDTNKSIVKPRYHDEIARVGEFMLANEQTTAIVEGHTDSRSDDDYNQSLSESRAQAVREYLISKFGIAANRLGATGFGESRPIADNGTADGRQRNRRVIVEISKQVSEYK